MSKKILSGKGFVWHHVNAIDEKDFEFLEKEFQFHPLDFDDLRNETELSKMDVYKYYLFLVFTIPVLDARTMRVGKQNLAVFISKDYVVTVARQPILSLDRFFARVKRSSRLKREVFGKSTGYFLYKLLDYVFKDAKTILSELVRETNNVELAVYDSRTKVTTKRLGILRRNILFLRSVIDPQRILIPQIVNTKKSYIGKNVDVYFDDVKDTLDSMWVVAENLKNSVDGLFDVNEAFLSHKTNEIIRLLTVISVVLMPATLVTGYFGMNVESIPFAHSPSIVTLIILGSVLLFLLLIIAIDRRK